MKTILRIPSPVNNRTMIGALFRDAPTAAHRKFQRPPKLNQSAHRWNSIRDFTAGKPLDKFHQFHVISS